ncbi:hypothetical protein [Arthrobacter sp. PAMC 25486]|uniref:hypothetical protein n=1 Tax=Arthrobacter sp. PAMC 25486 TaxID=1494608 RepID=UPI003463E630
MARGLRELQHFSAGGQLGGHAFFTLSGTYGFPTELSREEAVSRGMNVSPISRDEFDTLLSEQRARSQKQTTLGAK